jgi:adenine deaminase
VLVDGRLVARDGRLTADPPEVPFADLPGYPLAEPSAFADPAIYAPSGPVPVMRYESAVINRRAGAQDELRPGQVHAALVARDGSWVSNGIIEGLIEAGGFATTATTSLELLVLGTDPAAMARAAARVAELQGGFAFDGGWSAALEIDGLITAGKFDNAVTLENHLSHEMAAHGYRFHDPLYSLLFASGDFLPEVRLTPRGVLEVKSGAVLAPARPLVGSRR